MASKAQVELLKQDTRAWNRWRREDPEIDVDLREADLSNADLYKADLRGADLYNANLSGANLWEADLTEANLDLANLNSANLKKANLYMADISEANLSGAKLSFAKLMGATLSGANLSGAKLRRADLSKADLRMANLEEADLVRANLEEADLIMANLTEAILSGANLTNAKFAQAILHKTNLSGANLSGAFFHKAYLQGAKFFGAIVDNCTRISDCQFDKDTDFELVELGDMKIDSGTRQLLEYSTRKNKWDKWCDEHPLLMGWFVRRFWRASNYGLSTPAILKTFFSLAIVFAIVYYVWGAVDCYLLEIGDDPGIVKNLFVVDSDKHSVPWCEVPVRSLYFSVVTMTTLGFGDMYSKATADLQSDPYGAFRCGAGHLLLMIQVLLGYVLLGVLVTRFAVLFAAVGPAGKFVPYKPQKANEKSEDEQE